MDKILILLIIGLLFGGCVKTAEQTKLKGWNDLDGTNFEAINSNQNQDIKIVKSRQTGEN
ncbi:MAG: hypothetical protein LUC34_01150 [Campylobacter sp.]|nr:hypothetical protein [Campylobacter sp.]